MPGSIEVALQKNYTPPFYRNQLLAETMVNFNMIDTQSMGIRKVYKIQKNKYFPMPDYDFSVGNQVSVTVYGKVLDENYCKVLFEHPNYDLQTVFLIDQVQKHRRITSEQVKYLRKLNIIEGRIPNIYISAEVAKSLNEKEQYVKNKGFDDAFYKELIIKYKYLRTGYKAYRINKDKYDTKPVSIALLSSNRKISNMIFNLSFYQKEAVKDSYVQCTYNIYITDANGNEVSDIQKIIADKTSTIPKDREFKCTFNLKSQQFSNTETYYLVIVDEEGKQVPIKEEVQIDIAMAIGDFDFFGLDGE